MATPMQELAKQFTAAHQAPSKFDLGGSETLPPKILTEIPRFNLPGNHDATVSLPSYHRFDPGGCGRQTCGRHG